MPNPTTDDKPKIMAAGKRRSSIRIRHLDGLSVQVRISDPAVTPSRVATA
jgi:hypothetical protein